MIWQDAHEAIIIWLNEFEGGRKEPAHGDEYYPISCFPNEDISDKNAQTWSVRINILDTYQCGDHQCSKALVKYFNQKMAPNDNFLNYYYFKIYEGSKLVGHVKLKR